MTGSTYICDPEGCVLNPRPLARGRQARAVRHGFGHCWHETTQRRLDWQGGPSPNADADLTAWNRLGMKESV